MDFKEIVSYTVAQARQEFIAIFLQSAVIIGMSHYGLNVLIYCICNSYCFIWRVKFAKKVKN